MRAAIVPIALGFMGFLGYAIHKVQVEYQRRWERRRQDQRDRDEYADKLLNDNRPPR